MPWQEGFSALEKVTVSPDPTRFASTQVLTLGSFNRRRIVYTRKNLAAHQQSFEQLIGKGKQRFDECETKLFLHV